MQLLGAGTLALAALCMCTTAKRDYTAYCGGEVASYNSPAHCESLYHSFLCPRITCFSSLLAVACKAVIDEVRFSISKEDPYKTIQVSEALHQTDPTNYLSFCTDRKLSCGLSGEAERHKGDQVRGK